MASKNLTPKIRADISNLWRTLSRSFGFIDSAFSDVELGDQLDNTCRGAVPSARLNLATQPTANDTVTVGAHVFKFVAALGAADTFTQIKIGTDAATSRASFIDALNGVTNADVKLATTSFAAYLAANFSAGLYADLVDTSRVRIRQAATHGLASSIVGAAPLNLSLSEGLTAAADIWNAANLNVSGRDPTSNKEASIRVTITAAMIAAGKFHVEFPFVPGVWNASLYTSAGVPRWFNEALVVDGNALRLTLAGGGDPNVQETDVLHLNVRE